jgi:ATP-dependent RNA helicase DeaD
MSDKTEHPPLPEAFAALGVRNSILRGLADLGYVTPSEIQALLIPKALAGADLLGQARTGTGKTAAFGIPILCRVERGAGIQSLILAPTRELAVQVGEEIRRMAKHTPIRVVAVYGGQKIQGDIKALQHHPEIVVGTPGRVIDLLDRRLLDLQDIRFLVLDEVDRMLDIGFRDDIRNILSRLKGMSAARGDSRRVSHEDYDEAPPAEDAPEGETSEQAAPADDASDNYAAHDPSRGHQTIFVSATFTEEIERLARRYMREPVEKLVAPGADDKPTVENVEQYYLSVQVWDKYRLLRALLKQEQPDLAIIFCRTKHGAEKLAKNLTHDGIDCREIHGNLRQNARDSVMKSFKGGKFDVLVATDLASRGIDVAGVSHIINYDVPEDPEVYIHRIGRTARMGAGGKAFMFVLPDQGEELTRVENVINMIIPNLSIEGFEHRDPPNERPAGASSTPGAAPAAPVPPKEPPRKGMRLGAKMPPRRRR